ncbi:MAG TPA: hypothetical protein VHP33_30475 [Polyangiaceae bacterium]|nr:hypothetical protein [Polyangiaceae bacterium]
MTKKWLLLGVFGLALVINPYLGCSSKDDDFDYTESEMKEAVLGDWVGTADIDGESADFTLSLQQASAKSNVQSLPAPKVQPQCASRSFVKPAAACWNTTTMPLVGTITSVNPALNGVVDGEAFSGSTLDSVNLSLHLEDGKQLSGMLKKGSLSDGSISSKVELGTFSLARL